MNQVLKQLALVMALLAFGAGVACAENIVIKGSTTVLPIAQVTLEAYMKANPGSNISLSGGGSGEGIKALIDKSTNIANSSREIKKTEEDLAKSKGVNPMETVVAIDAIVPIVNPRNPVKNLSVDQLSQIYQGKITNWKEVGGEDLEIVVISRDSSSGTFEAWGELVLKGAKVSPAGAATGLQRGDRPDGIEKQIRPRLHRPWVSGRYGEGPDRQRCQGLREDGAFQGISCFPLPLHVHRRGTEGRDCEIHQIRFEPRRPETGTGGGFRSPAEEVEGSQGEV